MAPVRRPATPPQVGANFGDLGFYGGSLIMPEGLYAVEWNTQMFQPTKKTGEAVGQPFLAVMMTCTPINEDGSRREGDVQEHPLSMGQRAKEGWAPSGDGKSIVQIPGTSVTLNDLTNWGIMLKSLYDTGLPRDIFTNSLSSLDGIWLRTQNIPEPESRKELKAKAATGEQAPQEGQEPKRVYQNKTVVSVEILEGGKPWEGGGGIPEGEAETPAPKTAARKPATAPAAGRKPVAPPPPPPEEESQEEDVEAIAQSAIADVLGLEKNANGCPKVALRAGVFQNVNEKHGEEMAGAVIATFFDAGDPALNKVLGPLGYLVKAGQIKVK